MSDTTGLIIGGASALSAECAFAFFFIRWVARRPIKAPCAACGKPTGSLRLSECSECQRRRHLAEFDALVERLEARQKLMWAELGLNPDGEPQT